MKHIPLIFGLLGVSSLCLSAAQNVQVSQLPPATAAQVDTIAARALTEGALPSVSLAIVQGGGIVYEKAYGKARLDPPLAASATMRYPIGSISKQFLAAAMLLLVQDGKVSLDDRVSQYLPTLTRSNDIRIRQLLSHTAGYQDYYPQDYTPPFLEQPVTPNEILDRWASKPLDFEPGSQWQYSNTNYVVAGRIVEQVTGEPLNVFIDQRILQPLRMTSALDLTQQSLGPMDPVGYMRYSFGPLRPAHTEARGWVYAAGELAMTAHDLALWDISLIQHTLLTAASLDLMTTPARLTNGAPTDYALGILVTNVEGHPKWAHFGGIAGFRSSNSVWPDQTSCRNHCTQRTPQQTGARFLAKSRSTSHVSSVAQSRRVRLGGLITPYVQPDPSLLGRR